MGVMNQPICFLGLLSGWEIAASLAIILTILGRKFFLDFWGGTRRGFSEFKKSQDEIGHEAGRAVGGIFGKPAAEAITPGNEVAELYDPRIYLGDARRRLERIRNWFLRLFRRISKLFGAR